MIQFKQTPIGEIPDEWGVVRLEDVVEINKKSKDPTKAIPDDKFFYVDIESIEGGTGVIKTAKEIFGKDAPSRARRVIHQNDVIMSTVRPYLKAFAIVPKEYDNQICSTGFAVLSCRKEILPHYLLYTLFSKAIIEQCSRMMVGGQYPALNQSQVKNLKLSRPPLPEQRRIAEILTTADTAIRKVDDAMAKTERLKRGLMQELLTKGIGHEEFKDSEVGRIPREWGVVRLIDVARIRGNKNINNFEKLVFIPMELISESGIFVKYQLREKSKVKSFTYCEPGDLLLAKITPSLENGKQGIVPSNISNGFALATTEVFPIQCKKINKFFLFYVLKLSKFRNKIIYSMIGTTGRQRASKDSVKGLKIPLPPLPEQHRIAEILSTVDKKLELERKRKEKLERIKKGLMNELLTGKKRVTIVR